MNYREGSQEKLFDDVDWGQTAALRVVHEGADVVFAAGGGTADAVLETAAEQKVMVIGAETDPYMRMTDLRPWLITSAINDIHAGIRELIGLTRAGKFPSGNYFGQTRLAPFHEFENKIPPGSKDRLNQIINGIEDGSIKTGIP